MKVWVVQSGEYEQRGIDLIAESFDAAVEALKRRYAPPYVVTWDEPVHEPYEGIGATFASVRGYSVAHSTFFDIQEWDVEALVAA